MIMNSDDSGDERLFKQSIYKRLNIQLVIIINASNLNFSGSFPRWRVMANDSGGGEKAMDVIDGDAGSS